MTHPNRPPAFKLPSANPRPLFLWFGHGDYVIARTASEASCFWMDHFDDLCSANDFVQIPDFELVEFYLNPDYSRVSPLRDVQPHDEPVRAQAAWFVDRFGPGYLASTTED